MASTNGSTECTSANVSTAVPQWKRDLIQRRRQQNKVSTSTIAGVKLSSPVSGTLSTSSSITGVDSLTLSNDYQPATVIVTERLSSSCVNDEQNSSVLVVASSCVQTSRTRNTDNIGSCTEYSIITNNCQNLENSFKPIKLNCQASCGATCCRETIATTAPSSVERANFVSSSGTINNVGCSVSSVVCSMRLETDASSYCPISEDATNFKNHSTTRNNHSIIVNSSVDRDSVDFDNYDSNDDTMRNYGNNVVCKRMGNNREQDCDNGGVGGGGIATRIIRRIDDKTGGGVCLYPTERNKTRSKSETTSSNLKSGNGKITGEECESDSSEELQYGPGIVNRLKSKYLNLTLREMNKSRGTVQRFRRAASLEDLLDCDDEQQEQTTRKYAKRSSPSGVAVKTDRYRNATRGNESMKRARSVETLMRYNVPLANDENNQTSNRLVTMRQEPVNDHIVLIDRSTVKIESRLTDTERPKAINKPKRIKPLLAETERPPADLVKTTMRLFEGSVKKFKPKGEVAVKVATFKTINDTYKAQAMKKVVPKPPIQPKPFVNGSGKVPSSPKKIHLTKSTTEIIDNKQENEEYRRDGVLTDTIVQSVSSVVSKFQQIEKSYTPTGSPEPNYKVKFSPSPSPEPYVSSKLNRSNENLVKSPPCTPVSSPRISSPGGGGGQSPGSPKKDLPRQHSTPVHPPQPSSPSNEMFRQVAEIGKLSRTLDNDTRENSTDIRITEDSRQCEDDNIENMEITDEETKSCVCDDQTTELMSSEINNESVDGDTRTISKTALENISKAGITMQYNFGDKPAIVKSYLPGIVTQNDEKTDKTTNGETMKSEVKNSSPLPLDTSSCSSPMSMDSINDEPTTTRLQERLETENNQDTRCYERTLSPTINQQEYTKPIGAISSLAMIKSTTAASSIINDTCVKTMRNQKTDVSPPQKQIGIIRPLVSTKTQQTQQNLSNRELEKNLINRVKSIEQPTKVVVSLKSAEEIQPVKKTAGSPVGSGGGGGGGGGGGLWDTKPWNQANNTMVFNFSNRKDVPDYIENDGLIIRRKREKQKVGDGGVIVLDATLDASTTDDSDWEISGGPPSPCDVSFTNDNVLINGRSNLSKQPRNHKHRIQFDDGATRTFEYPSEASMLEDEGTSVDGDPSSTCSQTSQGANKTNSANSAATMSSALLGGGGLASFTPSKVDLTSEGFELGVTRTAIPTSTPINTSENNETKDSTDEYLKSDEDAAGWGAEATADLLY